jgi:ABC-2 type transport system permease protein
MIADVGDSLMINFATYPDGIFKGIVKWALFTIIPLGLTAYLPVKTIISFNPLYFAIIVVATIILVAIAVIVFNLGLKRYSSSNLMSARV